MYTQAASNELAESVHQFVAATQTMGRAFPTPDQRERPGLTISWANVPFPFYNQVILTDTVSDPHVLRQRCQEAAAYMRSRETRGVFVACLDLLDGPARTCLPPMLAEAKLEATVTVIGMAGDLVPLDVPPHPDLHLVRLTDGGDDAARATVRDWAALKCDAYDFPPAWCGPLAGVRGLWRNDAVGFVAYEGSRPVSTVTVLIIDDCLYLSGLVTAPHARGKGYAEAIVRHTLLTAYAHTGISRTVMHTIARHRALAERLGCHPTSTFVFCSRRFTSPAMPARPAPPR
jgi:GNAT superfamily N-acetyltransferase